MKTKHDNSGPRATLLSTEGTTCMSTMGLWHVWI